MFFAEIFLRIIKKPINQIESVYHHTQFNINHGLEFKSNYKYEAYGYEETSNSFGFYSPPISLGKKGKRIAYIGDSYSVGPGISLEENFPHKVSSKLKEKIDLDYLVAAVPGTSPFSNKFILKNKVIKFKPDIVVYQSFDNDIADDYIFAYSQYHAKLKVWNSVPSYLRNSILIQRLILISGDLLTKKYSEIYESTKSIIKKYPEKVWNEYSKPSLNEILKISKENNAKLIILHIPSGLVFPNEHIGQPLEKKYILGKFLEEWAKENKVPFIDMYDDFVKRNTEEFNEIYLPGEKGFHLTREGADIVSRKLYDTIRDELPN